MIKSLCARNFLIPKLNLLMLLSCYGLWKHGKCFVSTARDKQELWVHKAYIICDDLKWPFAILHTYLIGGIDRHNISEFCLIFQPKSILDLNFRLGKKTKIIPLKELPNLANWSMYSKLMHRNAMCLAASLCF